MGQQINVDVLSSIPWTHMVEERTNVVFGPPLACCGISVFTYMYIHMNIKKLFKPGIV